MTVRDQVLKVLEQLPDDRVRQVLDFARFLQREDAGTRDEWMQSALAQFEAGYGPDEPEYTLADVRTDRRP